MDNFNIEEKQKFEIKIKEFICFKVLLELDLNIFLYVDIWIQTFLFKISRVLPVGIL